MSCVALLPGAASGSHKCPMLLDLGDTMSPLISDNGRVGREGSGGMALAEGTACAEAWWLLSTIGAAPSEYVGNIFKKYIALFSFSYSNLAVLVHTFNQYLLATRGVLDSNFYFQKSMKRTKQNKKRNLERVRGDKGCGREAKLGGADNHRWGCQRECERSVGVSLARGE